MKNFIEPFGKFVMQIPEEWQYKEIAADFDADTYFCFVAKEKPVGAFQVRYCTGKERPMSKIIKPQFANTCNLDFIKTRVDNSSFNVHAWYTEVHDHTLIAKYIYEPSHENNHEIIAELEKAEAALASLMFIATGKNVPSSKLNNYDKYILSLGIR